MKIESTTELVGQTMTYGGGAGAVAAWTLSLGDVAAVVGACVAVIGLALQVWVTLRRDKREAELHRAQMSGK